MELVLCGIATLVVGSGLAIVAGTERQPVFAAFAAAALVLSAVCFYKGGTGTPADRENYGGVLHANQVYQTVNVLHDQKKRIAIVREEGKDEYHVFFLAETEADTPARFVIVGNEARELSASDGFASQVLGIPKE